MSRCDADGLQALVFKRLRRAGGSPDALPALERSVVYFVTAQSLIENGGLPYFFEADFPNRPPYPLFAGAYKAIGARQAAARFEAALALFPFPDPHLACSERNEFIKGLQPSARFHQVSDAMSLDAVPWRCLRRYLARHSQELRVPPSRRRGASSRRTTRCS